MHSLSPADELSEIRTEIARLRTREAQLRAFFLTAPLTARSGRWARIVVEETHSPRFNPNLLPDLIRQDSRFTETRLVQTVRCLPITFTAPSRPGWPITQATNNLH